MRELQGLPRMTITLSEKELTKICFSNVSGVNLLNYGGGSVYVSDGIDPPNTLPSKDARIIVTCLADEPVMPDVLLTSFETSMVATGDYNARFNTTLTKADEARVKCKFIGTRKNGTKQELTLTLRDWCDGGIFVVRVISPTLDTSIVSVSCEVYFGNDIKWNTGSQLLGDAISLPELEELELSPMESNPAKLGMVDTAMKSVKSFFA